MAQRVRQPQREQSPTEFQLWKAVATQDLESVKRLIELGTDPNAPSLKGLLRRACQSPLYVLEPILETTAPQLRSLAERLPELKAKQVEIVRLLLKHGVDVHYHDDLALLIAIRTNHIEMVKVLIDEGEADVNAGVGNLIREAIAGNHLEIMRLLIDEGKADVNAGEGNLIIEAVDRNDLEEEWLELALEEAAEKGLIEMVALLLDIQLKPQGTSVDFNLIKLDPKLKRAIVDDDPEGVAPFLDTEEAIIRNLSVMEGSAKVVEVILKRGTTPEQIIVMMETAIEWGHVELVKLLLKYGADPFDPHFMEAAQDAENAEIIACFAGLALSQQGEPNGASEQSKD